MHRAKKNKGLLDSLPLLNMLALLVQFFRHEYLFVWIILDDLCIICDTVHVFFTFLRGYVCTVHALASHG